MMLVAALGASASRPLGRRRESRVALGALLAGLVCFSSSARAGDMTPASAPAGAASDASSVLDGRSFTGEIGHVGEEAHAEDVWKFRDGMFVSKECEKCGFPESPYWVRFHDDGVRFKARTRCPRTDAILEWNGIVKGDEIEGTLTWTKERWYWTIEKAFWFKGELLDADVAMGGK